MKPALVEISRRKLSVYISYHKLVFNNFDVQRASKNCLDTAIQTGKQTKHGCPQN